MINGVLEVRQWLNVVQTVTSRHHFNHLSPNLRYSNLNPHNSSDTLCSTSTISSINPSYPIPPLWVFQLGLRPTCDSLLVYQKKISVLFLILWSRRSIRVSHFSPPGPTHWSRSGAHRSDRDLLYHLPLLSISSLLLPLSLELSIGSSDWVCQSSSSELNRSFKNPRMRPGGGRNRFCRLD